MAVKKGKKICMSKVKRSNIKQNKLSHQGKLRTKRHKKSKLPHLGNTKLPPDPVSKEEDEESDLGVGLLEMVDEDDLTFLKDAISNRSYSILKQINYKRNDERGTETRKRSRDSDGENIEENYEKNVLKNDSKKKKYLLPIKTKEGLKLKTTWDNETEVESPKDSQKEHSTTEVEFENDEEFSFLEVTDGLDINKPVSVAQLLAHREEILQKYKFKIGILSSGLIEDPENKSKNFKILLDLMVEKKSEIYISTQKLASLSLLEIFKDLLPSYQIKHHDNSGVKLKKDTLQLQTYEKSLLKFYKTFLQKLEQLTSVLKRKKGQRLTYTKQELKLAEVALSCLCELLIMNPHFNFSNNLAQILVPFLNHHIPSVREMTATCIKTIFGTDKRGDISLNIVRYINHLVKSCSHSVHYEVLDVLLALRIKEVNLDKEKEEEVKQKKFMTHKQKLLRMSKRERKRSKKLEELEKELLETKAEENKNTKQQYLTEITKVVFTIYFRILKCVPSSKVLSVTLEGLARFAHCINLDYYQDIVNVMDDMIETKSLGIEELLHCIETVFTILTGQGDVLNIDPSRFYTHLYKTLLHIHAGCNHKELCIALRALEIVLIHQRRRISHQRLLAFAKRLSTLSLQLLHNGSLGCLSLIKTTIQMNKSVDVLLETDTSFGEGIYSSEMEEPEYCNASNSSLWELTQLQRHYHPTVQTFARNILCNVPVTGERNLPPQLSKMSPEQLFKTFDSSEMAFHPPVTTPKKLTPKPKPHRKIQLLNEELEMYIKEIVSQPLKNDFDCPSDFL